MPVCTICSHKNRDEIEKAILDGQSQRLIASQFNVNYKAVQRHIKNHLPPKLAKSKEAKEVTQADSLMSDLYHLRHESLVILDEAKGCGDLRSALASIDQLRKIVETLFDVRIEIEKSVVFRPDLDPAWTKIKLAMFDALEQYPEARLAVSQKLKEIKE